MNGAGTATLSGVNTFSGGVTIDAGTLELGNSQAAGSGAITFGSSADPTLKIDLGDAPTNQINGIAIGNVIDLQGVGTETAFTYVGGVLTVSGGSQNVQLDIAKPPTHAGFVLASDGNGGTLITVTADPGPTITPVTPSVVENGQTTEIGTVAPGLAGDTLTLEQTGGSGTVSLQLVNGVEEIIYTAPATITAGMLDAVSYTVMDEYNDVVTGSSTVPVAPANDTNYVGTAGGTLSVGNGNDAIDGRTGHEHILAGNGADIVFAGPSDVIIIGNGNDTVLGGAGDTVVAGNGMDTISTGANSSVIAGNGSDAITVGDNSTVIVGNGNNDTIVGGTGVTILAGNGTDTISTGANSHVIAGNGSDAITVGNNSTVIVGNGHDTITAGESATIIAGNGNDTVIGGEHDVISLGNGANTIYAASGDTINVGNGQDTFAFGLAPGETAAGMIGPVTINDFSPGHDVIKIASTLASWDASYTTLASHISYNSSGSAVIDLDASGDTITLVGVHASSLHASDFQFI